MKSSFTLLPMLLAVMVLSGCPDAKLPKVPPKIPEPKAMSAGFFSPVPTAAPEVMQRHDSA